MNWNVGDAVRYRGEWLKKKIGSRTGTIKEIKDKWIKAEFSFGSDVKSFLIDGKFLAKVEVPIA